jgi:hypothetical protein
MTCGANNSKGIHLRNGLQNVVKNHTVNVEPSFTDPDNTGESYQICYIISVSADVQAHGGCSAGKCIVYFLIQELSTLFG